jgi:hypothetical protein
MSEYEDDTDIDPDFCWYCTTELQSQEEKLRGVCDACFKAYNEQKKE